jgi:hypothetical protein
LICTAAGSRVVDPVAPTSRAGHATAPKAVTAWAAGGGGGPVASAHSATGSPGTGGVADIGATDGCGATDGGVAVGVTSPGALRLDTGATGRAADAGAEDVGAVGAVGEPASVAGAATPELLDEQPANAMVTETIMPRVAVRTGFIGFSPRTFGIVLRGHRSQNEPHPLATRILGRETGLFQARFASYDPKGQGEKS